MKYFLHDSSAFEDEKVTELFMAFGYEGLGLFYTILEKLAKQEKPIKTHILKAQLKVGKKLEKCWNFMESIDIISSNNGETFNKQLLNYSEKYKIKKENSAKRLSQWRENQTDTKNETHYNNVRNASKVKVSKVKVSKVNTLIESVGDLEAKKKVFANSLIPFVEKYGSEMIREFYDYWTEPTESGKSYRRLGQKYFDISRRLANWKRGERPKNFIAKSDDSKVSIKTNRFN